MRENTRHPGGVGGKTSAVANLDIASRYSGGFSHNTVVNNVSDADKIPAAWQSQFRKRLHDLGMTQRDLDRKLPDGYGAKILAGMISPTARTLHRLCDALELDIVFRPRFAAIDGVETENNPNDVESVNKEDC